MYAKNYQTKISSQEPINSLCCRRSSKRWNYKQLIHQQQEEGGMYLNLVPLDDLPSIGGVFNSPISKFIIFVANNFGYTGTNHYLMVNWKHPILLKKKICSK